MTTAYFDIESASAEEIFTHGPGFTRLGGVTTEAQPERHGITTDTRKLIDFLLRADTVAGHNIFRFDLIALALEAGEPDLYDRLAAKAVDTIYWSKMEDPPGSRKTRPWGQPGYYSLDSLCTRKGLTGKTDDLPALAREFAPANLKGKAAEKAGYGLIPVDDPRYRSYLEGDLDATRALYRWYEDWESGRRPEVRAYREREMRLAWLQNRPTLTGWAVDGPLLAERVAGEEAKRRGALAWLADEWDLPVTRTVGRGRGSRRVLTEEEVASPLATDAGRAWLAEVYAEFGVKAPPLTPTGKLKTGADDLAVIRDHAECPPELRGILRRMAVATGATAKYAEIARFTVDGRIHPEVGGDQSSGRWAYVRPSATNMGKRGGRVVHRAVLTADPGELLLPVDFSQVDMRAIAGHSRDPEYMRLFTEPDPETGRIDPHSMIARRVFGSAAMREEAKPIGHGWNYGLGIDGQVRNGVKRETAEQFDAMMTEGFPVLCAWREELRERAGAGELLDNGFGRLMRCDPDRAYTQAPALMGQGGARDIMAEGLLRAHDAGIPPSWLRVVVHDEAVYSIPKGDVNEATKAIVKAFTMDFEGVPIEAEAARAAYRWDECYKKD